MADVDKREEREKQLMLLILILWSSEDYLFWISNPPSVRYFAEQIRRRGITDVMKELARDQTRDFLDEIEWTDDRDRINNGVDVIGDRYEIDLAKRLEKAHRRWLDEHDIAERDDTEPPPIEDIYKDWEAEREAVTSITTIASETEGRGRDKMRNIFGVIVDSTWELDLLSNWCPICLGLAGQPESVWTLTYPMGPPGHINCRCFLSNVIQYRSSDV